MLTITNIVYLYFPLLFLLLLTILKDRFEPIKESLKRQRWSFMLSLAVIGLNITGYVILSFWWLQLNGDQNLLKWKVGLIFTSLCSLGLMYIALRFIYKFSIINIFNLKQIDLPFILKICVIYTSIVILDYYFVGIDSYEQQELVRLKSMDTKNLLVDTFASLIIAPIAEESIYRGILYVPLYRKVGKYLAMIITSLVWTFGHPYEFSSNIGIFVVGLFLAWLYDRSGSLLHPIIFHMVRNNWLIYYILREI